MTKKTARQLLETYFAGIREGFNIMNHTFDYELITGRGYDRGIIAYVVKTLDIPENEVEIALGNASHFWWKNQEDLFEGFIHFLLPLLSKRSRRTTPKAP